MAKQIGIMSAGKCLNAIGEHCVGYLHCDPLTCTQLRSYEYWQKIKPRRGFRDKPTAHHKGE